MFTKNPNKRRFPAVVLQYLDPSEYGYNQYIPFGNIETAEQSIREFFTNGGRYENLGIFVDPAFGKEYARRMHAITKDACGVSLGVYAINSSVLHLALG